MKNERRISVYTSDENVKKMKMIAIRQGTTVTSLLNKAIREIIITEDIEDIINKNKKPLPKEHS